MKPLFNDNPSRCNFSRLFLSTTDEKERNQTNAGLGECGPGDYPGEHPSNPPLFPPSQQMCVSRAQRSLTEEDSRKRE